MTGLSRQEVGYVYARNPSPPPAEPVPIDEETADTEGDLLPQRAPVGKDPAAPPVRHVYQPGSGRPSQPTFVPEAPFPSGRPRPWEE